VIAFNFLNLDYASTQSELLNPCESSGGLDTDVRQSNPANVSEKFVVEYTVQTSHHKNTKNTPPSTRHNSPPPSRDSIQAAIGEIGSLELGEDLLHRNVAAKH
jgi:hypothetical protein